MQVMDNENQIVVYQPNETVRLDVRLENETVWLTQEQMSLLFGRDQSVIARHVAKIFKEGELDRNSVYAYTASDGKRRPPFRLQFRSCTQQCRFMV